MRNAMLEIRARISQARENSTRAEAKELAAIAAAEPQAEERGTAQSLKKEKKKAKRTKERPDPIECATGWEEVRNAIGSQKHGSTTY